jgi:hypothetical protein
MMAMYGLAPSTASTAPCSPGDIARSASSPLRSRPTVTSSPRCIVIHTYALPFTARLGEGAVSTTRVFDPGSTRASVCAPNCRPVAASLMIPALFPAATTIERPGCACPTIDARPCSSGLVPSCGP